MLCWHLLPVIYFDFIITFLSLKKAVCKKLSNLKNIHVWLKEIFIWVIMIKNLTQYAYINISCFYCDSSEKANFLFHFYILCISLNENNFQSPYIAIHV